LSEVSNIPLQQSVADLGVAYKNFFDSLKGKRKGERVLGRIIPPKSLIKKSVVRNSKKRQTNNLQGLELVDSLLKGKKFI
jgi:putative transposase